MIILPYSTHKHTDRDKGWIRLIGHDKEGDKKGTFLQLIEFSGKLLPQFPSFKEYIAIKKKGESENQLNPTISLCVEKDSRMLRFKIFAGLDIFYCPFYICFILPVFNLELFLRVRVEGDGEGCTSIF